MVWPSVCVRLPNDPEHHRFSFFPLLEIGQFILLTVITNSLAGAKGQSLKGKLPQSGNVFQFCTPRCLKAFVSCRPQDQL